MIKRMLAIVTVATIAAGAAAFMTLRRAWATWGIEPRDADRPLPGDDLVPQPTMTDTRGITIDAPPAAVWPWLAQLGYGRGGWYSYDQLDVKGRSADRILPEFQALAVGDIVPTDPGGGFEAKVVEPGRALVLMIDNEIAARRRAPLGSPGATTTAGVEASGRFMAASMPPEFAVSWAIVLEPLDGDRTRLVERIRGSFGAVTPGSRALGPLLGLGIFAMTRRQMLGIKARAERAAQPSGTVQSAAADASSGGGHAPELAAIVEPAG